MGIVDCLRAVGRSQPVLQEHRTVMVSWASPRHRFLTSSGLTAGPFGMGSASDQPSKPAHGPLFGARPIWCRASARAPCVRFFMESLILAQDERWRRAYHMQ